MKKLKFYTSILLVVLAFAVACKKEKPLLDISDKDPCSCAQEVSAEFEIHEILNAEYGLETFTDHVFENRTVRFTALEDEAEYKWYLGSEILTGKSVSRYFNSSVVNMTIPITLVVNKNPNKTCFPDDDGYDSVVKYMDVVERCAQPHMLEGTFRFAEKNSTDSIDIRLERGFYGTTTDCEDFDIEIIGQANGFCSGKFRQCVQTYRELRFHPQFTYLELCPNAATIDMMRMNFDNSVYLKIWYRPDASIPFAHEKEYYGRKLN